MNNASRHILSYPFLKSIKQKYSFLFSLRYLFINVHIVNICSAVLQPFQKPIWLFFKILFSLIKYNSLLFRKRLKSLPRQLPIVMAWKLSGFPSSPNLGIRIIIPQSISEFVDHSSGYIWVCRISLNKIT